MGRDETVAPAAAPATEDLRVAGVSPIVAPEDLKRVFPITAPMAQLVSRARHTVREILHRRDPRLLAVVGPCSVHDPAGAIDYAQRLTDLAEQLRGALFVVLRLYFEKPRTTIGWKGLVNDPDLDGTYRMSKGLGVARRLLCEVAQMGLPVATEVLSPINPQYFADLISWGCIGARTSESQLHREMVSGLSFPVGVKNSTDGNLRPAIEAVRAAAHPHSFLGVGHDGRAAIVGTRGNPDVHVVLRGGASGPNYQAPAVAAARLQLREAALPESLVVDCSHGNSGKAPERQDEVLRDLVGQVVGGETALAGFMMESYLEEGAQRLEPPLAYGVSVTDACRGWEATRRALVQAAEVLGR